MSDYSVTGWRRAIRPVVLKVSSSRPFAVIAPHVLPQIDRGLYRLTRGRHMIAVDIVPTLLLTSTGAKTSQPREVPLACLPRGDDFYVVGSNYGREQHPAWTANLLAHPDATVSYHGQVTEVTAALLDGDERIAIWPDLLRIWPVYSSYEERSGRALRVFRLAPRTPGTSDGGRP